MRFFFLLLGALCLASAVGSSTKAPAHKTEHHSSQAAHKSLGEKHDDHKHVKKAGKESKHHVETSNKGNHGSISHKIEDDEKALKKSTSKTSDSHQSHKKAAAHHDHSAKIVEGAKQKKTGFLKGFHEKYSKNDHKKHDSFYSHGKKSGDWKTFGAKNSKHSLQKFDKNEHKSKLALKSLDKHGKSTKKAAGHHVEDHKTHKVDKGKKNSHYEKQQKWAKKHQKPEDKHKYRYTQLH